MAALFSSTTLRTVAYASKIDTTDQTELTTYGVCSTSTTSVSRHLWRSESQKKKDISDAVWL